MTDKNFLNRPVQHWDGNDIYETVGSNNDSNPYTTIYKYFKI
jgi:hypothetical protein